MVHKPKMKLIKHLISVTFLILLALNVNALGIAPSRKIIDFEPNLEKTVQFEIINNEGEEFKAIIDVRGELSPYVEIKKNIIEFSSYETRKSFDVHLKLPKSIEKPGLHEAQIVVIELPKKSKIKGDITLVKVQTALVAKLMVRVPFPKKYAEAKLFIETAGVNRTVRFTIPVFNYGKQDINKVKAQIDIFSITGKKIATIATNEVSIKAGSQQKLTATWKADVNPGVYRAIVTINYDNNLIKLEKKFDIGSLHINIIKVEVLKFTLGQIAAFDTYIENQWNQPIPNIYATVIFLGEDGKEYARSKTATIDLDPYGKGKITAYWDTKDITIGIYYLNITIHYAGKITNKLIKIQVNLDSISTAPVAKVIKAKPKLTRDIILITTIIVLVTINIAWFIYFQKLKKRKR